MNAPVRICILWNAFFPDWLIGKVAAFARRSGDTWFVGIINAGEELHFRLGLEFLGPLDHDALWAYDHPNRANELLVGKGHFTGSESMNLDLQPAGGFTGRFMVRK